MTIAGTRGPYCSNVKPYWLCLTFGKTVQSAGVAGAIPLRPMTRKAVSECNGDFVTTVGDCYHVEPYPPSRVNLMTYFEDLSPYEYSRHLPQGRGEVLNVGWLDDKMSYSHGAVDVDLTEKLLALCTWPVNQYFGWHTCPFCQECPVRIADLEGEFCLGDGEIRVPRNDSKVVYAAPNLIYHYVTAHQYLPPAEFLDSLRDLTLRNPALD